MIADKVAVLIMDDNPEYRHTVKQLLMNGINGTDSEGILIQKCPRLSDAVKYITDPAKSEAVQKASHGAETTGKFDILIADLQMRYIPPNMESDKAVRRLNREDVIDSNATGTLMEKKSRLNRRKQANFNSDCQPFTLPGSPTQIMLTSDTIIHLAEQNGLDVLVLTGYRPDEVQLEGTRMFYKGDDNFKDDLYAAFSEAATRRRYGESHDDHRKSNSSMSSVVTKFVNSVMGTKGKLMHLTGRASGLDQVYEVLSPELLERIERNGLSREEEKELGLYLKNEILKLDMRKAGARIALCPRDSIEYLRQAFHAAVNGGNAELQRGLQENDENLIGRAVERMGEAEIMKKYIDAYNKRGMRK